MRQKRMLVMLMCGTLLATACGSDDDESESSATAAPATQAPAVTDAPATTAAPATTEAPPETEAPATTDAPPATEAPTSTDAPTTDAPTTDAPTTDAPIGPASGDPVTIGYIIIESPAISQATIRFGAEATVQYVNEELGGLAGRPMELQVCKTLATPESSIGCANELIAAGVSAVMIGADIFPGQIAGIVTEAGIPYITTQAQDDIELKAAELTYVLTGGTPVQYRALAQYAEAEGWSNFTIFATNVPSLITVLESNAVPAFEAAGVELDMIAIPPDAADFTPFAAEGLGNDPSGYYIIGVPNFCVGLLNAIGAAGSEAQQFLATTCIAGPLFDAVGDDGVDGALMTTTGYTSEDSDEFVQFTEILETYSDEEVDPFSNAFQGYQAVLTVARLLNAGGLTADDTSPEAVDAALSSAEEVPLALGGEEVVSCDGQQMAEYAAVCSNTAFLLEINGRTGRTLVEAIEVS